MLFNSELPELRRGDEIIKREDTDHMAALIPGAGELILPNVSHFAHLQDPEQFNEALLHFLSRP
jgi:pimeloyl-ACP methyl ester carboxylesterase